MTAPQPGLRPVLAGTRHGRPNAQRCLADADEMLRGVGRIGPTAVTAGWWPNACACLIRLALEVGIDAF